MKIIGLTGGIGSGKTTVLNFFKEFDIPVYVSDLEAKKIMHANKEIISKVIELFGEEAYIDGKLNRAYIGNTVFHDKEKLKGLNQIVHPAVHRDFLNFVEKQDAPYIIYESALLFENKSEKQFDEIILVISPKEERIKRVQKRDNLSREDIESRISNQLTDTEKIDKANYIISNINLDQTKKEVQLLHETFVK